jgi:hypothetical protein
MSKSDEIETALARLQYADRDEFEDILAQAVIPNFLGQKRKLFDAFSGNPGALDQIVEVVEHRADLRGFFIDISVSCLLVETQNEALYEKFKDRLLTLSDPLINLYRGKYPDPEIETYLCKKLFSIAKRNPEPWRSEIARCMGEVGTRKVLPTLRAILEDAGPTAEILTTFPDQHGPLGRWDAMSQASFVETIRDAIDSIEARHNTGFCERASIASDEPVNSEFDEETMVQMVRRVIDKGECDSAEFKSTFRWDIRRKEKHGDITHASLKTIAAFLNSEGGCLLVGVADDGSIIGTELDGFDSDDKYLLHFYNVTHERLGIIAAKNVKASIVNLEGKSILKAFCNKSSQPVYYKKKGGSVMEFFIRNGPQTISLPIEQISAYIDDHFKTDK